MLLLTILMVLGLVQLWGSGAPLHRDDWFRAWVALLRRQAWLAAVPPLVLVVALAGPLLLVLLAIDLLAALGPWMELVIAVPVLLYSLGRGEFSGLMQSYLAAWSADQWETAVDVARRLEIDGAGAGAPPVAPRNWPDLHLQVLSACGYRGFERMFAVLFWFILLGPAGALMYRLSAIYASLDAGQTGALQEQPQEQQEEQQEPPQEQQERAGDALPERNEVPADAPEGGAVARHQALARRWLWLLEWPAVRVLGGSFALTGNFVGCMQQWREFMTCFESSSAESLLHAIRGALIIGDEIASEVPDSELRALQALMSRTLLLWLCLVALLTLII